ncbi:MAG: hypothetical protein HC828_01405 [Blastochloris sp.]|nr:hypothetical protein [Blastochloris sp.]
MSAQPITLFAIALIGAAGLNAALAAWTMYHRTRGYFSFALLMLALSWWSSAYAMELTSGDLSGLMLWVRLEYVAIVVIPPLWLMYAWRYGGYDRWLSRRHITALTVIPLITLILAWTNEAHHLIWTTTALLPAEGALLLDVSHGWWFWIHTLYSYTLILTGSALFYAPPGMQRRSTVPRRSH